VEAVVADSEVDPEVEVEAVVAVLADEVAMAAEKTKARQKEWSKRAQ
jgi:hypothetical protein